MSYNESLSPNGNYPAMTQSQWDAAPWNEPIIPERDFDVDVEYVLKKTVTVTTNKYLPEYDEETGHTDANTEDTNWEDAYNECHYTIPQMLNELKSYIEKELEGFHGNTARLRKLKDMLEDCKDWDVYDTSFTEAK